MIFDHIEYRIGFGIGETGDRKPILESDANRRLHHIYSEAAEHFGGYTSQACSGGWVNPDGELCEESGVTLTILVQYSGSVSADDDRLAHFARWIGRKFEQHSVVVSRHGVSALIESA